VNTGIAALVLAAGTSRRMGARNKLLCSIDGRTLIARAAQAALGSRCGPVIVVTGADAGRVEAELEGLDVRIVRNPDYADGMSASLRQGLAAVGAEGHAALVMLADMPGVDAGHIDRLVAGFDPRAPRIVVPVRAGRRGHPVLWPRRYFSELAALQGDLGARDVLRRHSMQVQAVEFDTDAIFEDIDTPEQLAAMQGPRAPGGR
jgi:molybdenum cofactor cytidylyltransferase